ncbi:TPM domain-containing protein [Bacillus sp. FJAT-29953]|uniref:TPM domain-containing protein n=2 Tax=Bacillaceae TaxID=186817 RepID=A0A942U480_9BACI|nr:TPM domain-containing protein [Neobacillus sp. 114]MBS4212453.1 TPM domain-containing protein [Neobacillus rhizophilus]MBU8914860.1 TPM domain-containing protein [Bacillus sp. FJAT-29953]
MQKRSLIILMMLLLVLPWGMSTAKAETFDRNHYIYDYAHLLTDGESAELQHLASEMGKESETAFIIISLDDTKGKDVVQYVEDFYDEYGPGYDQPHGNTAILAIDMNERDVYLAGFKKAEQYLDDSRLDLIRGEITPDLSDGQYFDAFSTFLNRAYEYMGNEPENGKDSYTGNGSIGSPEENNGYDFGGIPSKNIFFQWWFQLIVSLIMAGVVVVIMAYRAGGKVTVNARTYMDSNRSKVVNRSDNFIRQIVTRQRKPSNNTNSGGGGITSGGHSHSGSRGKF